MQSAFGNRTYFLSYKNNKKLIYKNYIGQKYKN